MKERVLLSIQWAGWRSRFPLFGDGVLPQPANLITVGEMKSTVNKIFHELAYLGNRSYTYLFPSRAPGPTPLSTFVASQRSWCC
jgi:hypothetical protein